MTVALIGCGRLGSAILEGWLASGAVAPSNLLILTRSAPPDVAREAERRGAKLNLSHEALHQADTVVLAVKPAQWREALEPLTGHLNAKMVVVSVMAGVNADTIAALANRPVARVMPTTAVARQRGVAAIWSADAGAARVAETLFAPLATVVTLDSESQMDAATAVAGSAPAFVYAFVKALAEAGEGRGLSADQARNLAVGALRSAEAGLEGVDLEGAIARIASPGGTTEAGLNAMDAAGIGRTARAAVDAAVDRAGQLRGA